MPEPIRVLVVDDHPVVTSGLAAILFVAKDLKLVGMAASAEEALVLCANTSPDVVLMDLVMPGMDGVAAIRAIRLRCPQTQVIALTSFREMELVQAALRAGAIGYLLKTATAAELIEAIRNAHKGQITLSPEVTHSFIQSITNPEIAPELTARECDVLALVTRGQTNQQIALELQISLSTVQFHLSNIFSKLDVSSRVEAAVLAERYHLCDPAG